MKRAILLFLPFIIMLGAGCLKTNNNDMAQTLPEISGSFSGQFIRLRLNQGTQKYDTLKANINLTLNTSTGFAIDGDTTAHAGSKGDYGYDSSYFTFKDNTYPLMGYPSKVHLAGLYAYAYSNNELQLQYIAPLDTLVYYYDLKKQ